MTQQGMMKAIVCTRYGSPDGLQLQEVSIPTINDTEVLIKVRAGSVTVGDALIRGAKGLMGIPLRLYFGLRRPRRSIMGIEFAGVIESVGKDVTKFTVGDEVYGQTGMKFGCYAQYVAMGQDDPVVLKPTNLTFEEAAVIPIGAATALFFLREKADIQSGQSVLIYGASGSVGTYAVQLAKHFGATVTGVCGTANLDLVRSLGADTVIDYTKEDFNQRDEKYDHIFAAVNKLSASKAKKSLKKDGRFISVMARGAPDRSEDLVILREIIEAGDLRPAIDRRYPMEQTAEAHVYVDTGRKRGNVVLTYDHL